MRKSVVAVVVVVLTLFVGSSSLRAQEDQEENGNFEGTYRGFAYAVYTLARIMREGAVEGKTQEPPCGTNVVQATF